MDVAVVGVGPAAAAAAVSRLLARGAYSRVISTGIGGGFAEQVEVGGLAIATRGVAADLGADSPEGFRPLDELGFGPTVSTVDEELTGALRAALPHASAGAILTVSTVTGTAARAAELARRFPDAVAEAMEGYAVACAAALADLPFAEVRAVSNVVGPRDRAAWRIGAALDALTAAAPAFARVAGLR